MEEERIGGRGGIGGMRKGAGRVGMRKGGGRVVVR